MFSSVDKEATNSTEDDTIILIFILKKVEKSKYKGEECIDADFDKCGVDDKGCENSNAYSDNWGYEHGFVEVILFDNDVENVHVKR